MNEFTQPIDADPHHYMGPGEVRIVDRLVDRLTEHDAARPRSQQDGIGISSLGVPCDRRLAYAKANVGKEDIAGTLAAMVGTAFHSYIEKALLDSSRYLLEMPVSYRGIPGNLDAYDLIDRNAIDWKTTKADTIRRWRQSEPPTQYQVQVQTYAAALLEKGHTPRTVSIVAIPTDSGMDKIHAWTWDFDKTIADKYVNRYLDLPDDPDTAEYKTSYRCNWCPYRARCERNR